MWQKNVIRQESTPDSIGFELVSYAFMEDDKGVMLLTWKHYDVWELFISGSKKVSSATIKIKIGHDQVEKVQDISEQYYNKLKEVVF